MTKSSNVFRISFGGTLANQNLPAVTGVGSGGAPVATLTVVDATRVLLGNGPQGGSLDDVRVVGAVCAGIDPVLCDVWGAAQLDVKPSALPYLAEAERRGLGRSDLSLVRELGKG